MDKAQIEVHGGRYIYICICMYVCVYVHIFIYIYVYNAVILVHG
jgi:hypothetical protein